MLACIIEGILDPSLSRDDTSADGHCGRQAGGWAVAAANSW